MKYVPPSFLLPSRWSSSFWRPISLVVCMFLAACTASLQSSAPRAEVYVLRPIVSAVQVESPFRLQVLPVRVRPGYATDAILRSGPDRTLDVYAASRWPDVLPRVVEGMLVDGLKAAGIGEVLEPLSSARAEALLQVVVRRFDADYSMDPRQPRVHVQLDITLLDRARRDVLTSFTVGSVVPVAQNRMSAIIAAFEQAGSEVLTQLSQALSDPALPRAVASQPEAV